jgi:hypothetical protein
MTWLPRARRVAHPRRAAHARISVVVLRVHRAGAPLTSVVGPHRSSRSMKAA